MAVYANRSMNFVNLFNPNITSDGFTGFMQRKFPVSRYRLLCSPTNSNLLVRMEPSRSVIQWLVHPLILLDIPVQEARIIMSDFTNVSINIV